MNIGDITVVISVLAGMTAIPFAASSISIADDYNYGLAAILNSTPEFAANLSDSIPSLISKTTSDEGIRYVYRTPYGEYSILISPEKFEETLLKAGKKVSALQSSSEQIWELSLPAESLVINHSSQKIVETYRNLNGYLRITKENGWVSQDKSGTATEEELQAGMLSLEEEMNGTISLMKNMSEKILNASEEAPSTQIQSAVINSINPSDEFAEIQNNGTESIFMSGWKLINDRAYEYTFPSGFGLTSGAIVKVHSNQTNTCIVSDNNQTDLCWNKKYAWRDSGDTATLKDVSGNIVFTYCYGDSC